MNQKVTIGDEIKNHELDITYRQQHMGISFDHIKFDGNFVLHSLEDVFEAAMRSALNRFYSNNTEFVPVVQARVNGQYIGCIGMIRFYQDQFEFSHFETGNRDFELSRKGGNWELHAVAEVNRKLREDELYPYYFNLTVVKYDCDGNRGCGEHFAKAVLTFLNAFSRFKVSQLPSQKHPEHISTIAIVHDSNSESENIYATFTNKDRYNVEGRIMECG